MLRSAQEEISALPGISEMEGNFQDGTEDLEPLPQVGPGRALGDLSDVDDSTLFDLKPKFRTLGSFQGFEPRPLNPRLSVIYQPKM